MYNITIEDNIIDCPTTDHGILIKNTDGVVIRRNQINSRKEPIVIESCVNVCVDK